MLWFKVDILGVVGVAIQSTLCAIEKIIHTYLYSVIDRFIYLISDYPLLLVIGACGKVVPAQTAGDLSRFTDDTD